MPSAVPRVVQNTKELARILAIPRRTWTLEEAEEMAGQISRTLVRRGSSARLRPIQGWAIFEGTARGGLFAPIHVGGGKTLTSLLLPFTMGARRPLLLLPAKLIGKTERELRILAQDWPIPNYIRFMSYEMLGRSQSWQVLEQYQPDLIVADEAHKLKNPKAAVTKRVSRYMTGRPTTKFVALSGTFTKRSIKDYSHIIQWCLPPSDVPLPTNWSELEDWSDALDEKPGQDPIWPGALLHFCTPEERRDPDYRSAARNAYRRRLTETFGVVATKGGKIAKEECSITIAALECDMPRDIEQAFQVLRDDWTRPDGWTLGDAPQTWACARQLALGFYYRWDPRPPDDWYFARKAWASVCRYILANNQRNLDSEKQVVKAVRDGHYPKATPFLQAWESVKDSFVPNTVPVWISDAVIDAAHRWALEAPGIVWVEHTAFGERLAKRAKLAYYGAGGVDSNGRAIELHDPSESVIASQASSGEGRNLQAWNRNLIVSFPPNDLQAEQLLGRTHRPGQNADEVTFDVVLTALEHFNAFWQATADARMVFETTGADQKLCYADVIFPIHLGTRMGPRWEKPERE